MSNKSLKITLSVKNNITYTAVGRHKDGNTEITLARKSQMDYNNRAKATTICKSRLASNKKVNVINGELTRSEFVTIAKQLIEKKEVELMRREQTKLATKIAKLEKRIDNFNIV